MNLDLDVAKGIANEILNTGNLQLVIRSLYGDVTAPIQLLEKIGKTILTIPDIFFYKKFEAFLKFNRLSDNERAKLSSWIVSNGEKEEFSETSSTVESQFYVIKNFFRRQANFFFANFYFCALK